MKNFLLLPAGIFLAALAWRIGSIVSADALSMAIGVLFGMLAGLPVSLLVLVSQRSAARPPLDTYDRDGRPAHLRQPLPPVIIFQPSDPSRRAPTAHQLPERRWYDDE